MEGGLTADHPRHYPPVRSHAPIDPTGAGDVFLAALAAARIEPRLVGGRIDEGFDLLLAAAAASLVLEGPGLLGVPDRGDVARRMARRAATSGAGRPVSIAPGAGPVEPRTSSQTGRITWRGPLVRPRR